MTPQPETSRVRRALRDPRSAVAFVLATARGHYYKLLYSALGRRFTTGRRFRVFGSLSIKGPGRVEFGENVTVWQHVTPWTHSPDAVIRVGDNTRLAGVRMGCVELIDIGPDCIVAECRIMDSDFHSTAVNRHELTAPIRRAPVRLARNVWVAANAGLLPGTTVGENSVISFGAICSGTFPPNVIVVGNPGRIGGKVSDPAASLPASPTS